MKGLISILALVWLASCGVSTDFKEMKLLVIISATPTAPEGAEGTSSPKSVNVTLQGISWIDDSTGEAEDLWEDEPEEVLILNRERILIEKDVKDRKDKTYSNFTVSLSTAVTVQGKYEVKDLTLDPTETDGTTVDIVYAEPFTFNEGKGRTIEIDCNWYKTVTSDDGALTDTITNPSFTIDQTEN